jgi:hypothetical protein
MEAYKHPNPDERTVRNDAFLTCDRLETERGAPLITVTDEEGSESHEDWGAAIHRFTDFENEARREFDDPTEVTYGVSRPECIAGESDEEFEPVEEDEHVSEVADEESEEAGLCEQ